MEDHLPKHAFEESGIQDSKLFQDEDQNLPSSLSSEGSDQSDVQKEPKDDTQIDDLEGALKELDSVANNNSMIPEEEEVPKKSIEESDQKDGENKLPNNFVTRYLKEKHPEYYLALLEGKEKFEDIPVTTTTVSTTSPTTPAITITPKEPFPKEKSKGEQEAERLAKLTIAHQDFDQKIKKPLDEKLAKESADKLNDIEKEKNLVCVSKEITIRIDDKTTMIIDKLGDADIITENENGEMTTRKIRTTTCRYVEQERHIYINEIYQRLTIPERLKLALSRFIVKCQEDRRETIQSFSWKSYDDDKTTMAELLVKQFGGRTLPKEGKLATVIGSDSETAKDLRRYWIESCKIYCILS